MPSRLPRLLVTGFNAFPGAPLNPTELLVAELARDRQRLAHLTDFRAEVIDVDYRALRGRLVEIAQAFKPDIAIHFGLSAAAHGFRLERLAWNRASLAHADNRGFVPSEARFCSGADSIDSALPLGQIHVALTKAGLPVEYSDSAGEYLCNYLFYVSRAGLAKGFKPRMTGFIHVPPLAAEERPDVLTLRQLVTGAILIIETCIAAWSRRKRKGPASLPGPVSV
jgi:pyroglutamyl-peptidase